MRRDVIVVGAGICGLATAYELTKRGKDVLVLEAEHAGAGQSAGEARIFRIAHRDPRLRELAHEARAGWRAWEREFNLQLLGDEGLVWAVEDGPLDRDEIRARVPLLRADHPYEHAEFDPLAGSLRSREALAALASRVEIQRATVTELDALEADAVVVCAGLDTQRLVAALGIDLELTSEPHVRVTYAGTGACLISPDCYALPLGTSGRYAIGMHEYGAEPAMFALGEPLGTIECVSLFAPWLDHGDGWVIHQAGRVIALGASNAMKFGPLLGKQLADRTLGQ
jgi:glycine/D-amino acid oxidase-like deaminating enzyme